ncbi:hypothetical protein CYMTET_42669 [Cymbomonas tetramitiformis]|uniref:Uncharacterized protein n=1 Tax=Cymbomonas tetramitiformis TaxID=36881 RepID=A0AAE0C3U1_9CHLO|nr:hypothetical protein CYMTET_42669 [Cymbomonas tetramitiformis]
MLLGYGESTNSKRRKSTHETDEGTIQRAHVLVVLATFLANVTQPPERLTIGAVCIPTTSAKYEYGGVQKASAQINWSLMYWLWCVSDSASTMVSSVSMARLAKLQSSKDLLAMGPRYPDFMPKNLQPFFLVLPEAPRTLIPICGPWYIPDKCHIDKNGEAHGLAAFGRGVQLGSLTMVNGFLKGEAFRFARVFTRDHEVRDIIRCHEAEKRKANKGGTQGVEESGADTSEAMEVGATVDGVVPGDAATCAQAAGTATAHGVVAEGGADTSEAMEVGATVDGVVPGDAATCAQAAGTATAHGAVAEGRADTSEAMEVGATVDGVVPGDAATCAQGESADL